MSFPTKVMRWPRGKIPSPVTLFLKAGKCRTHGLFECFKKFVVYLSVFLVVRPPDVLCLPPSLVSKHGRWVGGGVGLALRDLLLERALVRDGLRAPYGRLRLRRQRAHLGGKTLTPRV